MKQALLWGLIPLGILHFDIWNFSDHTLMFGFLPAHLAYHIGYCIVVCVWMYLLTLLAWDQND